MNEADTCRTYVLPKLKTAGWEDEYTTEQIVVDLDSFSLTRDLRQARLASLREPHKGVTLQSQTQEELRPLFGQALLPSVLRPQGVGD